MTFEFIPDIGCIGLVGLLYAEPDEEYPLLIANLSTDEIRELITAASKYLHDTQVTPSA